MTAKVIACETLTDEVKKLVPDGMSCRFLDFGLHIVPGKLHDALREEIEATPAEIDTILLGYGLCSRGVVGLEAGPFRLVIPRVDDCTAIFLGSRAAFLEQHYKAPGTFYLSKGWIEWGDDPYTEYLKLVERYGHDKAYRLERAVIENYTRIALIHSSPAPEEGCRVYARRVADLFGLAYDEIPGSDSVLRKLIDGEWDDGFVVVEPGSAISYESFYGDLD